jgi:polyisoprenoid-binding protein YceI
MSSTTAPAQTGRTYTLDAAHSTAAFVVRHLMIAKVRGHFNGITGSIQLPAAGHLPVSVEAVIDASTVDTRDAQRDGHLRSPDFFDVATHPQLTFRSTRIEGTEQAFRLTGDLTIHGTTREVTFDATFEGAATDPWGNQRISYEATAQISRLAFGMSFNQTLETGGVMVSDEVKIELNVEAIAAQA